MQEPTENSDRFQLDVHDVLVILVCGLLVLGLYYVWHWNFPPIVAIPLTAIILFSMYYQIMFWVKQLSLAMIMMDIEDRIVNEYTYQIMRRGYSVKVESVVKDETRQDSEQHYKYVYDMPKWKKSYVLPITIMNVILFPAWRIREFEGQDDVWD